MSVQTILLNKDSNQRGIYDAQLHSCQVYKTPVDPTDAVPLSYTVGPSPPLQPFEAVVVVGIQGDIPDINYSTFVTRASDGYVYTQKDWNCTVVGFQNEGEYNVENVFPSTKNSSGVNDGYWHVAVSRSLPDPPLPGTDYIWCLMTRKIYQLGL